MLNTFKIRKYWILTFCMILCSFTSMYSQDIPDNYLGIDVSVLTAIYKARGFSDAVIDLEIEKVREDRKKIFIDARKNQPSVEQNREMQVNTVTKKSSILFSSNGDGTQLEKLNSGRVSAKTLSAVAQGNLIIQKGVNTKFFVDPTSSGMTFKWLFYELDNVTKRDSATTPIAYQKYTLPGVYKIIVEVKDTAGCISVFTKIIEVKDGVLSCENHIAIVVDESGSIDQAEAKRIRAQLKSFIAEQAKVNLGDGKMYISLIGLSDTDDNARTDHIKERLVLPGDLLNGGVVYNWIENYGRRYGNTGISEGSDYWKSGLSEVLNSNFQIKPKLVFLITDGCQTTNPEGLRTLMEKFDNYQDSPDKSQNKPHLYVVGINNGFYVDNALTSKTIARNQDPNFVPSLLKTSFDSTNSTYLGKSLQYLFNFQNNAFPIERINGFDSASYFAHNDFTMLSDEPFYFSDGIVEAELGCGKLSIKDYCANCLSFQPEINKEYLLSAWVREETNIQVKDYKNSEINIVFYNDPQALDPDPNDPGAPSQIVGSITLKPAGAIIDGWQRISGKFIVPENAKTAGVVLNNKNVGIPIYFDDLRIHPLDGSVKTFVYDPETFKLMSELDENNYSTFYEYDNEGGLVRVKKETSQGVKTIQETRSGNFITTK